MILAGIEPCAVGSTVEVLINPHHAARPELLEVRYVTIHGWDSPRLKLLKYDNT